MSEIGRWLAATHRKIRRQGDGRSAVLRRRYDSPINDVWAACTDPARLRRWFGDVRGELRVGAELSLDVGLGDMRTGSGLPPLVAARVLRCEPPRRLVITWSFGGDPLDPSDEVELSLASDGTGTILELEHRSVERAPWASGVGAGWEAWIYRIEAVLAGTAPEDFRTGLDEANARQQQITPLWTPLPEATGVFLRGNDGRSCLRFERSLGHPRAKVWAAVTSDLQRWYPARLDGPLQPGATVRFVYEDGSSLAGTIVAFQPPALFVFSEQRDEVRIELTEVGDGTRLIFTHSFDDAPAPDTAAGWDLCLVDLERTLAGEAPLPVSEEQRAALRQEYERAFAPPVKDLG